MSKDISCLHKALTSTCAVNLATKPEQHLTSHPEIKQYKKADLTSLADDTNAPLLAQPLQRQRHVI